MYTAKYKLHITPQHSYSKLIMEAISARARLVNGNFNLPDETITAMREIRAACSDLAMRLEAIVKAGDVKVDIGRMIATMDLIQQVKDTACVSVILPHAK